MRNKSAVSLAIVAALGFASQAWCVEPRSTTPPFTPPSDAFQVRYASNLNIGDSVINITNGGTQGGTEPSGNICVNVYAFDPAEEMVSCCSCNVTPNALNSLSVKTDITANTATPGIPNSVVIKLLATQSSFRSCNAANPTPGNLSSGLVSLAKGMVAWGTTLHAVPTSPVTYGVTETQFAQPPLSLSELNRLTSTCGFIQSNGSGFGICNACRLGGL
jgi:hypothetical protein